MASTIHGRRADPFGATAAAARAEGVRVAQTRTAAYVLEQIVEEARATAPAGMSQRDAVEILIDERVERGILNEAEAGLARQLADLPAGTSITFDEATGNLTLRNGDGLATR